MNRAAEALELCFELGFDLAGVAPLRPPRAAGHFAAWLEAGHNADMDWLERNAERIADPRRVLPAGRSILAVGLGHGRGAVGLEGGGRVARYAAGRDYHNLVGKRLRKLARTLKERGLVGHARSIVDAGPLLERSHAAEAGLGFESKAANLLHRDLGPWFFLGELLLEEELEPTTAPALGSCGTCTACIDACPTAAILEPGVVDARRCISYQTIENRGAVPAELRPQMGSWVFGCDVCSEICPWGHRAPDRSALFGTHREVEGGSVIEWLRIPEGAFAERFEGSPLRRPGREGLARNAATVLGNAPSDAGREALTAALEHDSSLVREAAGWSLARAHGDEAGVAARLEAAARRETDPDAARGLGRWAGGEAGRPDER
ncbi:tRNA epoxyqueuosine(34) reductase QueG [Engelhardtia mirabilis]|uniref:Epoxyqueuosine reductase n=1 Tax=Engelhardtia mirabilis TaxID=2528011 RepID=A0A518BQG8_9BACT|nr:Epoxyqueuosine reductase [Planctomycetes bacterium Pla133]QDV03545.1 Epoxyqueuosine reductase [Planctomycetes bacterium Pla86]